MRIEESLPAGDGAHDGVRGPCEPLRVIVIPRDELDGRSIRAGAEPSVVS
jgi:hypothetical protein